MQCFNGMKSLFHFTAHSIEWKLYVDANTMASVHYVCYVTWAAPVFYKSFVVACDDYATIMKDETALVISPN